MYAESTYVRYTYEINTLLLSVSRSRVSVGARNDYHISTVLKCLNPDNFQHHHRYHQPQYNNAPWNCFHIMEPPKIFITVRIFTVSWISTSSYCIYRRCQLSTFNIIILSDIARCRCTQWEELEALRLSLVQYGGFLLVLYVFSDTCFGWNFTFPN